MGRRLRYVPRNALVEVTLRCAEGRMLLAPDAVLEARILGVLGRALHLFPVLLHAFQFMSNHVHMLMTVADAQRLAAFMSYFVKQAGDVVREVRGCRVVWQSRYWHECVLTDDEAIRRLRYLLSNGVKEGLVERPEDWPGISSTAALCAGDTIEAYWATAAERRAARRSGHGESRVGTRYTIRLEPLPGWKKHRASTLRRIVYAMCRDIEAEYRIARGADRVMGAEALWAVDPFATQPLPTRARSFDDRPPGSRREWDDILACVTDVYRRVSARRRAGDVAAAYPPGCFLPGNAFARWPDELAVAA